MDLQQFLEAYACLAVFIGTAVEGEFVLVTAAFLSHSGYFSFGPVILAAALGAAVKALVLFYVGRVYGLRLLKNRPFGLSLADKARRWLERFRVAFILGFRFLFGISSVSPIVIGMARIEPLTFALLNILGALIWAVAIGAAGYFFGHGLEILLGDVKRFERHVLVALAVIAGAVWLLRLVRHRRACPP